MYPAPGLKAEAAAILVPMVQDQSTVSPSQAARMAHEL